MEKASWLWYPGEYEIYHSNQLHSRREDYGIDYVTFWQVPPLYPRVEFYKTFENDRSFSLKVISFSNGFFYLDGKQYPLNTPTRVKKGRHKITVRLMNVSGGLPCIFAESEFLNTDGSWLVSNGSAQKVRAATSSLYDTAEKNPQEFPFSYRKISYASRESAEGGIIYDFSRETYARITLKEVPRDMPLLICYGESREESLDRENAVIKETVCGKTEYRLRSRAFRYITLFGENVEKIKVEAEYEYLPIEDVGFFTCDDPQVKEIYDVCSYTFHLNSREFYLDGIKRDHWVWAGDAYQSFKINNYLYFDRDITKRTIRALLGKPPYEQHINTINDYTMFLLISVWEYYEATADIDFVKSVFGRMEALYDFAESRLDENGFVCRRKGDWIFIDWSEMDKKGPVCAEQILLWQAQNCMGRLAKLCGKSNRRYLSAAARLKKNILHFYWDRKKQAFIDSYESQKRVVSRHANIFAIIYDFVDPKTQELLYRTVLKNGEIKQITTPYFKFYELLAFCKMGDLERMQEHLTSYWGGMLKLGATTFWEAYNPSQKGVKHYAMYRNKYGKSLCHAWGSGPIYLLGRYCLGVFPTSAGYRTFTVQPQAGKYRNFRGAVPLPNGKVEISYQDGVLSVTASRDGGTLVAEGRRLSLPKGETVCISCTL